MDEREMRRGWHIPVPPGTTSVDIGLMVRFRTGYDDMHDSQSSLDVEPAEDDGES